MISSSSSARCFLRCSFFLWVFLFCALLGACKGKNQKKIPHPGDKIYPVSVLKGSLEEIPEVLEIKGGFLPSDKLEVRASVEGKINNVPVNEGQVVNSGEVLATINPELLNLLLEKQRLDLKEAEARSEANLPIKPVALRGNPAPPESGPGPSESGSAPPSGNSGENRERPVSPDEVGESPPSGAPSLPSEKPEALVRAEQANLDRLKAEVALTEKRVEASVVKADIGGTITKKNVTEGSVVNAGAVLFQIVKIDPILFSVFVPKEAVVNLKTGEKIDVKADELPETPLSGEIAFVSPETDPQTRNYEVKISFANPQQKLKGGMGGAITLPSTQIRKGVTVPNDALIQKDGKNYVYVVKEQVAERREVELGKKLGQKVEVKKGVKEEEAVVIKGRQPLTKSRSL
jgi:multidrug efflux pump subunit AcrA (membrane-fusion protein)